MRDLHLDIETFSSEPIKHGVYRYAAAPDFAILLCAYAWGDEPVEVIDWTAADEHVEVVDGIVASERKRELYLALTDPTVIKHAHNATFERVCFTMMLRRAGILDADEWLDPGQWECSMVLCARCGYPLSLDMAGAALGLKDQKMKEGKALIKLFCTPHEETKGTLLASSARVMPSDYPEKWEVFKAYCKRDVEVEREIGRKLSWYSVTSFEEYIYAVDQNINDRGAKIDRDMVANAVKMDAIYKARLNKEAMVLTGLSNPNSVSQLKAWIADRTGTEMEALRKADIADMIRTETDPEVRRILEIRAEMGKTSCAKYTAMQGLVSADGRLRGMTQFYGSRTGRWAGRGVQLQNLPQNHIATLDSARRMVKDGDIELMELCYGNVPDTLSQLIRTAFVPAKGHRYAVCDFSAIEARVVAWLAGEDWVLDVFRGGGDIYCATASQMFGVPVEKHGQNAHLRQKGKVAVLALGYQGGVGALDAMGGQRMGMTEEEEAETVQRWRASNPHIVRFWADVQRAAENCVRTRKDQQVAGRLTFSMHEQTMTITLPSKRMLCYVDMQAPEGIGQKLSFMGMNQTSNKWERISTFGGKLTENIVQAVARDCLAFVLCDLEKQGFRPCFHVHDEVICEVKSDGDLKRIQEIFAVERACHQGLPLKGAGYMGDYYFKD